MRPVWMLSATQALCMSGSFLFVLLGGIIGTHLAPAPALATLPVSVLIAGVAASVMPAGVLIHRFGRRAVFVGSALQAAAGCVLAGYAITTGQLLAVLRGRLPARGQQRRGHAVPVRRDRVRGGGAGEPRDRRRHVRRPGGRLARARSSRCARRTSCRLPSTRARSTPPPGSTWWLPLSLSRIGGSTAAASSSIRRRRGGCGDRRPAGVPRRGARGPRLLRGHELHHDGDADQHARGGRPRRGGDGARDPGAPARHVPALARERLDHREVRRPAGDRRGDAADGGLRRHRRLRRARRPALRLGARRARASAGTCCSSRRPRC